MTDVKMINKYIKGEGITDKRRVELADDFSFMFSAITISKDKDIFNSASDNLKTNYNFIFSVIKKCSDDFEFANYVAQYYLTRSNKSTFSKNNTELIIYMDQLCDKLHINNLYSEVYKELVDSLYNKINDMSNQVKEDIDLNNDDNIRCMNFDIIYYLYGDSDIVMKCYANKFLDNIFGSDYILLEHEIHDRFNNIDILYRYGVKNFLLEFIASRDKSLSKYIINNIYLLSTVTSDIKLISDRWDSYVSNKDTSIYSNIYNESIIYLSKNKSSIPFNDFIRYVANRFNVLDEFYSYTDIYKTHDINVVKNKYDDETIKEILLNNGMERYIYIGVCNIFNRGLYVNKNVLEFKNR